MEYDLTHSALQQPKEAWLRWEYCKEKSNCWKIYMKSEPAQEFLKYFEILCYILWLL